MFTLKHKEENAHDDVITCCDWGSTETYDSIVTGSLNGSVKFWQWSHIAGLLKPCESHDKAHTLAVLSADLSKDAKVCATASADRNLIKWDTETREKICRIDTLGGLDSWTAAVSQDGKRLASGNHSGRIHIYLGDHGEMTCELDTKSKKLVTALAYSRDDLFLTAANSDGQVFIFDLDANLLLHHFEAHSMHIRRIVYSHDNKLLLTICDDKYAKLFDVSSHGSHKLIAAFPGASALLTSGDIARNQDQIITSSLDGECRLYDVGERKCIQHVEEVDDKMPKLPLWTCRFSYDGNKIITGGDDRALRIFQKAGTNLLEDNEEYIPEDPDEGRYQ